MAKKHNKNNDIEDNKDIIPPGEDQYMLGWDDAEKLENIKPGLSRSFIKLSNIVSGFHTEYTKGFQTYIKEHSPIEEIKSIITEQDLTEEFIKLLKQQLNK